ncbi:MAG: ATP-binding protein [Candidatus Omnitrophica bacterium]|nr:ATP-binding protein [Candidatus Omnitrophota bacterium]
MHRKVMGDLIQWKSKERRKPLILRGARQVGKTWLVRDFAKEHFENMIEVNFDKDPEKSDYFTQPDVDRCLEFLEIESNESVQPGRTLLFLDEIQAAPEVLARLRYFHEEKPDLHIVAAGSLLDFLLAEHDFSMPVGRIEYLHLGPMTFEEFLLARGEKRLQSFLSELGPSDPIPDSIHSRLLERLRVFWVVGGMPLAIKNYIESGDTRMVAQEHQSLLQTYEDDFAKYEGRVHPHRLRKVFRRLPALIGGKIKYSKIDPEERSRDLIQSLDQLEMARVLYRVHHSAGNGVPLGAEADDRDYKPLFLDIGLVSTSLGLDLVSQSRVEDLLMVNEGTLAEQFIGQHLLYRGPSYKRPELYYWNRKEKSSSAEVDYLVSIGHKVLPVEVKAGKSGRLKSLQVFVAEKKVPLAVRFNTRPPKLSSLETAVRTLENRPFLLLSLPLYLVGELDRMVRMAFESEIDET